MTETSIDTLFAAVYGELRRLAERQLKRQPGIAISPTTLLHEAYLDFAARTGVTFPDRARFMGYAARAMRGLLISYARERKAQKRGGAIEITSLPTEDPGCVEDNLEISAIGDALEELAHRDAQLAEIVDLKFFCGLTFNEIAALRGVSERTVQRDWERARMVLYKSVRAPSR